MKRCHMMGLVGVCIALGSVAWAKAPKRASSSRAASAAARAMMQTGVMPALKGGFRGTAPVTRVELAQILARFARALDEGKAAKFPVAASRKHSVGEAWQTRYVTRDVVAQVLYRVGADVAANPPPKQGPADLARRLPIATTTGSVRPGNPAYAAVRGLVKRRMVWRKASIVDPHTGQTGRYADSVLLHADNSRVTGAQLADAVSQLVEGYYDTRTAEPENHEGPGHVLPTKRP